MHRPRLIIALVALALGVSGPAWSDSESRPLGRFSRIQASTGVPVEVGCGAPGHAVVTSSDAAGLSRVKTEIDGETLVIRIRGSGSWFNSVKVVVTTPDPIQGAAVSAGASLTLPPCALSPTSVEVEASSGGSLSLSGRTTAIEARASSGGSIGLGEKGAVEAETGQIEASSGGSVRLCTIRNVVARASSGGDIRVGPAGAVQSETSSGGSVSRRPCL